jgi:hypothetical protein
MADPAADMRQRVVGVDVGQRRLAVATDMQHHTAFFPGTEARATADHYARLRKRLQQKGARPATRHLIVLAGRERRLKQDRNHLLSRHQSASVGISRRIVDALWALIRMRSLAWRT